MDGREGMVDSREERVDGREGRVDGREGRAVPTSKKVLLSRLSNYGCNKNKSLIRIRSVKQSKLIYERNKLETINC